MDPKTFLYAALTSNKFRSSAYDSLYPIKLEEDLCLNELEAKCGWPS